MRSSRKPPRRLASPACPGTRASLTILRASPIARSSSTRSRPSRAPSRAPVCWIASRGWACRARPSSPSTRWPASLRPRPAAYWSPPSIHGYPTIARWAFPSAGTACAPRSRECRRCSASTRLKFSRSWDTTRPPSRSSPRAMSSSYKTLNVTAGSDGYVVTVEFNRPEALNAMNTAMGEDLLRCFDALQWDKAVRVVVLTGSGTKAFCVGGDLKERQGITDEVWRAQHVIFEAGAARVLHCPVPVIAAVEGFAMGGGCELAVLSDFIVASETAVFAVPEVTLGIFPGIGGTQLLPRIMGGPLAKEMIFTGRRVPAAEAKAIGLVNHLVPAGQARAKALEIAATIAENGPVAVRQAKKAIAWGSETDLSTAMVLAIEAYNNTITTDDRLEGVRAFNEKRKPRFQGK